MASIIAPAVSGHLVESPVGWTGTFGLSCVVAVFGAVLLTCLGHRETKSAAVPAEARTS